MVSCIDRNSFAFFIFPLFLDTLITLLSLALPTLLLRSPSLISSPLSLPLQANRLLWWIQLSHLNFLQLRADSPTLMTLQRRQTSCTLTYDCAHVLFVCGGTGDRDREKSQCKLSSERDRESYRNTALEKSRVSTSFMRKECKARCTPSLPGLSCVEGVRKGGQGDEASEKKFQPVRLWGFLNAS